MKYLVVDAALSGTGIRDKYNGGYIHLESLQLSATTIQKIQDWLIQYENEHFDGYENAKTIDFLDIKGIELAKVVKAELSVYEEVKIEYYSDALMTHYLLD